MIFVIVVVALEIFFDVLEVETKQPVRKVWKQVEIQ